jgi:hypothetical protein
LDDVAVVFEVYKELGERVDFSDVVVEERAVFGGFD